ncbi:MAG: hypothetical protein ABI723_07110 [Bacteroidia bacterium]
MNKKKSAPIKLPALYDLPRDKASLNYLFGQLEQELDSEKIQVAKELFEMHRTSTGFDPMTLSKARIKRFRANDLRQFLVEINDILVKVMNKAEYENLQATINYQLVFAQFQKIHLQLESGLLDEAEIEIESLKAELTKANEIELLLSLNKICQHYYRLKEKTEKLHQTLKDYVALVQKLDRHIEISY